MKKLLIALCLLIAFTFTPVLVYAGPPMPIWHWRSDDRASSKLDLTADTVLTERQVLDNKWISNQGDAGEADVTLPALSYVICVVFSIEEAQNIEINPPSGELFDLDGVSLNADDCVDSDSTVGSKIVACRLQVAAGTWIWSLDSVRGNWVDTGATD